MIINGVPALACAVFADKVKGKDLVLEPLSKFPGVSDLIVDRSIIYEQLKEQNKNIPSQMLISPVAVHLSREEYAAVIAENELLSDSGFSVEDFGDGTVLVSEYPAILEGADIAAELTEIAGYLAKNVRQVTSEKLDWIFHSAACRAAVKAGDSTTLYEMQKFAEKVLSMPDIRYCPHGRPVIAKLTRHELERLFGRV